MSVIERLRHGITGALAACFLAGCGVHYLERNAPGIADIRTPPVARSSAPQVEVPEDPGGHLVVLSYGVFGGLGGANSTDRGGVVSYGAGPEVSLAKGYTRSSHPDAFLYPVMDWAYGVNLGWTALRRLGKKVGPLYAEVEFRKEELALALGWTWSPSDKTHGPQATLSFGPFYLRGTHEIDLGTQIHVGLLLKGYSAWSWSR